MAGRSGLAPLPGSTAGCGKPHVRWCGRVTARNRREPTRSLQLSLRAGQNAGLDHFLDPCQFGRFTVAEDRSNENLSSAIAGNKISFLSASLNISQQMRCAEIA